MSSDQPEMSSPRIRPERKWRTVHWKTLSGALTMITALAVVWAILSTFTARQREQDLEKAAVEIHDLYEMVRRLEAAHASPQHTDLIDLEFDDAALAPEDIMDLDELLDADFFMDEE